MSWVAVGTGALSVVGGLFGKKSAKKQQKQALQIQRDGLNFAKQQYADNQALYGDLNKEVVAMAQKGQIADLDGVSARTNADVATQFSNATGAIQRNQQRMGINPNSGRAESALRQTSLSQALAAAGGVSRAREQERTTTNDQNWQRKYSVYQGGLGQTSNSMSAVTNANNGLASSYQNMANNTNQAADGLMQAGGYLLTTGLKGKFGTGTDIAGNKNTNIGMADSNSGVVQSQARTFAMPSINNPPIVSTPLAGTTLGNPMYYNQD